MLKFCRVHRYPEARILAEEPIKGTGAWVCLKKQKQTHKKHAVFQLIEPPIGTFWGV